MNPPVCSVQGCAGKAKSRGWCERHYKRWYATGDPLTRSNRGHSVEERLSHRLKETPAGCWEFQGAHKPGTHQYGQLKVDGHMLSTHRLAYELWVGPIPDGMAVCHRCDNPPCCNPAHLFVGTSGDNMADMNAKGRGNTDGLRTPDNLGETLRARAASKRAERARQAGFPEDWKRCPRCQTWKSPTKYAIGRSQPDGLQSYCQACMSEKVRAWRSRRGA